MNIRAMVIEDYEEVYKLWLSIKGFAIRQIDDSKEGIERFIRRNEGISVVAEEDGKIVGSILAGHDGRRGCLYHVCVMESHRKKGIGRSMALKVIESLKAENISKISLVVFTKNELGNPFWQEMGWKIRKDLNYYDITINGDNLIDVVK